MPTARERAAIDAHIEREPWTTDDDGAPVVHITKTIASFSLGNGDKHPVEFAFEAVARADEDGRFEFTIPHEDGGSGHYVLTVERQFITAPTGGTTY